MILSLRLHVLANFLLSTAATAPRRIDQCCLKNIPEKILNYISRWFLKLQLPITKIYQYIFSIIMGCIVGNYSILYTHWSMDGDTYICPWYSQYAPSPPLLYFIISYVDAPCLWNIKWPWRVQCEKQSKRLLGALLTNNNNNTRSEIAFWFCMYKF